MAGKEATELLRDLRTLVSLILMPVLLLPVFLFLGLSTASRLTGVDEGAVYTIGVDVEAVPIASLLAPPESLAFVPAPGDLALMVGEREADAGLTLGGDGEFEIVFDRSRPDRTSVMARERLALYLSTTWYQATLAARLEAVGIDPVYALPPAIRDTDTSTPEELGAFGLAWMLPLVVMVLVMQVLSFPATDTMAGERERRTVESLLALPLTRTEVVLGKALVVGLLGTAPLLVNLLVIKAALDRLGGEVIRVAWRDVGVAFLAGLPIVVFFAGLFLLLAALARSSREANAFLAPVLLLFVGGGVVALFAPVTPTWAYALPGLGAAAAMKDWLAGQGGAAATLGAALSLVAGAAAISAAARRLDSEETVLGVGGVQWRKWWAEGRDGVRAPTPWEALTLLLLFDALFLLVGGGWQQAAPLPGVFMSQVVFFGGLSLLAVWALGLGPARVGLGTGRVTRGAIALGVPLGLAAWVTAMPFGALGQRAFPLPEEAIQLLEDLIMPPVPIAAVLLVVALAPAVCEEILFRGLVLSGLRRMGEGGAIVVSAALFAVAHMDAPRLAFTFVLGLILGWLAVRTGSIWPGVIVHFTVNATSVILARAPGGGADAFLARLGPLAAVALAGGGAALVWWIAMRMPLRERAET